MAKLPEGSYHTRKIRFGGGKSGSFEVTVPRDVIVREAQRAGIKVDETKSIVDQLREMAEKLKAIWVFDGTSESYTLYIRPKESPVSQSSVVEDKKVKK